MDADRILFARRLDADKRGWTLIEYFLRGDWTRKNADRILFARRLDAEKRGRTLIESFFINGR